MGTLNLEYERGVDGVDKLKKLQAAIDKAEAVGDDKAVAELTTHRDTVAKGMSSAKWDEDELSQNKKVVKDYKRWYKSAKGEEYTGSDEDAVGDFKRLMRGYNYALTSWVPGEESTAGLALEADNWSPQALQSFSDMSDLYDNTDLGSLSTAKNWASATLGDPTFLGSAIASAATFGTATPVTFGARTAAAETGKHTMKQLIKNRLKALAPKTSVGKTALVTATEAGAITGFDDAARQEVEDPDAEYDPWRGAQATALGFGTGGLLGGGVSKLTQWNRLRTGKGSKSDYQDKAITDNNAVKSAHSITNSPIRRLEDKVGDILAAASNKSTDWVKTKLNGVPGIGKELSEAADLLAKKFGEGPANSPEFKKELMGLLRAKFDVASGSKYFGAGTAPLRVQKHKTQLARGAVKLGAGAATSGITTAAKVLPRAVKGILSPVNQAKAEKLAWGKTTADLPPIKTDAEIQAQGNAMYRQQQLLNTNPQVQNVRAGGPGVTPVGRPQNAPDADVNRPGDSITRIAAPYIGAPKGVFKRDLVDPDNYRHFTEKLGSDKITVRVPKGFKGTNKEWLALSRDERIVERWKAEGSPKFTIGNSKMDRSEILKLARVFSDYYFRPDASTPYKGAHQGTERFSGITVKPGSRLDTAGHETGHSMDSFLNRDTVQTPIDDLGAPRGSAGKGLTTKGMGVPEAPGVDLFDEMIATMKTARGSRAMDGYKVDQMPAEGIADGFRLMMTHPQEFKSKHPEMYAYLDSRLRSDEVVKQFLEDTVKRGIDIKLAAKWAIALGATPSIVNAALEGDK